MPTPHEHSNVHLPADELQTYRELLAQQSELMVQVDVHGRFIFVSDSYCQLFAQTRDELIGQSFMPLVHPDDRDSTDRAMQSLWRPPYQCYIEQRALTRLGWRWLAWRDRAILDQQGRPSSVVGTAIDITERKQALEALQESENRYRQLFMHMQEAFCLQETIVDQQGVPIDNRLLAVNPAFEALMGMSAQELQGQRIRHLFPDIEDFWVTTFGEVALSRTPNTVEHFSVVRNRHYRVSAYSPRHGQFAAFIDDITQSVQQAEAQRLLNQRIEKTQRLEALSVLAAGAAHDFKNILMAIGGHADLARRTIADQHTALVHLGEISSAAQRASELCRHMMAFAGEPTSTPLQRIDLAALISEITGFLASIIKPMAEVHLDISKDAPCTHGDPGALRQVIMNLLINARDAIEEPPGRIIVTLTTLNDHSTRPTDTVLGRDLCNHSYAVIQVCDNGQGMQADVQGRIFEPFFSTKADGKGLGLAAALGIINAMNGDIHIASTPGSGTVMNIFLPTADATCASDEPTSGAETSAPFPLYGNVIFADDDPILCELGRNMLESLGLTVTVCSDGLEVLDLMHTQSVPCDAIIMDISMPRMGGISCRQALRKAGYTQPIILASGYGNDDLELHERENILHKPYSLEMLKQALASKCKPKT